MKLAYSFVERNTKNPDVETVCDFVSSIELIQIPNIIDMNIVIEVIAFVFVLNDFRFIN